MNLYTKIIDLLNKLLASIATIQCRLDEIVIPGGDNFFIADITQTGNRTHDGAGFNTLVEGNTSFEVRTDGVGSHVELNATNGLDSARIFANPGYVQLSADASVGVGSLIIDPNIGLSLTDSQGRFFLGDGFTPDPPQDNTLSKVIAFDEVTKQLKLKTVGGYIEVTYAQADTLVNNAELVTGALYKITDRGDLGIFLVAVSNNEFSRYGIRAMAVPRTYATTPLDGNNWLGIWYPSITPSVGDLTIWGGYVWENISGGSAAGQLDKYLLDPSDWTMVAKTPFTNNEYVEKEFLVWYDFANDWIEKQLDGNGNIVGLSYFLADNVLLLANNPVDHTDWNYGTFGAVFENNQVAYGIFDNIGYTRIHGNVVNPVDIVSGIIGNTGTQYIIDNHCSGISNNNIQGIEYNTCKAEITGNSGLDSIYGNTAYEITFNSGVGSIINNKVTNNISLNTLFGSIEGNTCNSIQVNSVLGSILNNIVHTLIGNTSTGDILNNQCFELNNNSCNSISDNICYAIGGNSNGGAISNNIIPGSISNNINSSDIVFNTNAGSITGNSNDGFIDHNSNLGSITDNTANVGDINFNNNSGNISTNSNTGSISFNYNGGPINNNTNLGDIISNYNAYEIDGNSNSGNIESNYNLANISGNSNDGNIQYNSNEEGIDSNSNGGDIGNNSNKGRIQANENTGDIIFNLNAGSISNNSILVNIYYNSNDGGINGNTITGSITLNTNAGQIANNSHNGHIENNRNNGNIDNCVGAGGFHVKFNINNGNIDNPAGLAGADISDPIVNK